jgi:hypothetical protein
VIIRFTSSLTAEDESVLGPSILKALTALLDMFPIAYSIRIDTSGSEVFQHSSPQRVGPMNGMMTAPPPTMAAPSARFEES